VAVSLVEALTVVLGVRGGGEGVIGWLERLPGAVVTPGRKRLFGADDPGTVTLGAWRLAATPDGVVAQLISGGVAVRNRRESGPAAAALVAGIVDQHAANLAPAQRDALAAQISALCEITEAGSV
jgi:hypothetical protein